MKKRGLSILLVLCMVLALLPALNLQANAANLLWPVPGHTNLSQGYHGGNAIDISDGSITGATIVAAMGGTVSHIFLCGEQHYGSNHNCNGFGTGLAIIGDDGRAYQYAHMMPNSIPANVYHGARVERGQVIGKVGQTGNATGYHLHFGISYTSKYWEEGPDPSTLAYDYDYFVPDSNSLPSDYYGLLVQASPWVHTTLQGNNIELADSNAYIPKQIFRYVEQSDGSYKIVSEYDGRVLTAENNGSSAGTNVVLAVDNGWNGQRWFIHDYQDGTFLLMPKSNTDVALDVAGGASSAAGTNIQLWNRNGGAGQRFSPYILSQDITYVKPSKPAASSVTTSEATAGTQTSISWTESALVNRWDARTYTLTVKDSSGNTVVNKSGITDTSYSFTFPAAGTYTAQVTAVNTMYYDYKTVGSAKTITVSSGSIALDANGGAGCPASITPAADGTYGELPTPTRDGYVFGGWYVERNSTAAPVKATDSSTKAAKLYAHWWKPVPVSGGNLYVNVNAVDENGNPAAAVASADTTITAAEIPLTVDGLAVKTIQESAFSNCTKLKSVTIPEGITTIMIRAFLKCTALTEVTLPDSLTMMDMVVFSGCSSLREVHLGRGLSTLDYRTFRKCISLEGIWIPTNITTIALNVFEECTSLKDIWYEGTEAQWNAIDFLWIQAVEPSEPLQNATKHFNCSEPVQTNPFADVAKGKFYYEPVLWAISQNPQITTGVTATTFEPDRVCTRAHVVTFLWRANGCPEPQSMTSSFKDVKDTSKYYYKAVLWASEQGITTGYSDGTFRPDDECTRGQVVTFLWRAKGQPTPASASIPFTDVPAGKYYTMAVLWALQNNITQGRTATTFGPDDACTRGHVVTFLYRAYA